MSEFSKRRTQLTLAGILLLGAGACSAESPAEPQPQAVATPELQTCEAQYSDSWLIPPATTDPEVVADKLGLTVEDTSQYGIIGSVHCPEAVPLSEIESLEAIILVPEKGGACFVNGIQSEPVRGKSYNDVVAICVPLPVA